MSEIRSSIQSWQKKKNELEKELNSTQKQQHHEDESPVLLFTPFGMVEVVPQGSNRCPCCRKDKMAELFTDARGQN